MLTKRLWNSALLGIACIAITACQPAENETGANVSLIKMDDSRYAKEPFHVDILNRSVFSKGLQPVITTNTTGLAPGSILVDTSAKQLFFVQKDGTVRRYGIAVGESGRSWKGDALVQRKTAWPAWYPTDDMKKEAPGIPSRIPPGADNPLGARALYLYKNGKDTLYRIHGTTDPMALGTEVSSGCIRMLNEDVIDLYDHVSIGARVIVR